MRLKQAHKYNLHLNHPTKNISDFGAKPSNPDNTDAFAAAVAWMNAQSDPACLLFEPGIYSYETSPNWAVENAVLESCGVVRLRYTGTGNAMTFDGGGTGGLYGMRIGRFFIEAPATADHGVYWRSMHHCKAEFNVRGCGSTHAGLYMLWSVVNEISITVSGNEGGGWYSSAKPKYGIQMVNEVGLGPPSWNTFINPILEGVDTGCLIEEGFGNTFYTGTMEGCTSYGLDIEDSDDCLFNNVMFTDFEVNTTADIRCGGLGNEFHGAQSQTLVHFTSHAAYNKIIAGSYEHITLDSGGNGTLLSGCTVNRSVSVDEGITDNATGTRITDVYNAYGELWSSRYFYPTSQTVTTGTIITGGFADVAAWDGTYFQIQEVTGAPGFDITFDFVVSENLFKCTTLIWSGRYEGNPAHNVQLEMYDHLATAWKVIDIIASNSADELRSYTLPEAPTRFVGPLSDRSVALVRFHHTSSGTTTHDLYIDYLAIR